jgi:hypothetical protein
MTGHLRSKPERESIGPMVLASAIVWALLGAVAWLTFAR